MNTKGFESILILVTSILLCFTIKAQPLFQQIDSDDGLSENVVNCILQDSKGFMWFGTNDGLNKYDGYNFTIYTPDFNKEESISSNLIFRIDEDSLGNLWVGTTGSGICSFDPRTAAFTNYKNIPDDSTSLSDNSVTSIYTDKKGRVWIGTIGDLNVFDPARKNLGFTRIKVKSTGEVNRILDIKEDRKGNIWLACSQGLFVGNMAEGLAQTTFKKVDFDKSNSIVNVSALEFDLYGKLIFSTNNGLYYQTGEGNALAFEQVSSIQNIQDIIIDDENSIWVGSYAGLHHFEAGDRSVAPRLEATYSHDLRNPRSLSKNLIVSLFKDRTGIIWIGINGGGVNKFDPDRKAFNHFGKLSQTNSGYEKIRSVLEDSKNNLWIGTEGNGLFLQDANNRGEDYQDFDNFKNPQRPFALCEIKIGEKKWLYIGSEDTPTLSRIDITKKPYGKPEPINEILFSVFSILQDRDQNIWLGTYNGGLHRWIPKADGSGFEKSLFIADIQNPNGLSNNIIRKILEDSRGNIWVGTSDGLNKIPASQLKDAQPEFEVFKNIPGNESSLSHNYILDIVESSKGDIWIGTFGGGLNKFIQEERKVAHFRNYTEKDGLPNGSVKSILEDMNGHLWIATNKGLTRFNPDKEIFQNYNKNDGLQGNEFLEVAAWQTAKGEMIFGGVNGFNSFYPENIIQKESYSPVVFTALKVLNKRVEPGTSGENGVILSQALPYTDKINLGYNENNFSVEFATLEYNASEQIQYAHILEGFENEWSAYSTEDRNVTYTNLSSGSYIFKVKSINADGIITESFSELHIIIQPPIWLTLLAFLLYFLLGVGLLWIYRRYELIGIKEKHQLKVERLEREQREEIHDLKLRFFTNISHEFRTPLTLIIAPLENLIRSGENQTTEQTSQQYHLMYKNSKYLLRLVNQLLDFRKLDQGKLNLEARQGDMVKFVREATEPFQFLANKHNIDLQVTSEDEKIYLWFDQNIIEKVLYNLLSNAFKFTPDGGSIKVMLREVNNFPATTRKKNVLSQYLEMEILDSGTGIAPRTVKRIFERFFKEDDEPFTKDGAGIGLSFTQSLIKRHYGSISVSSKLGEGSSFKVKLPMNKTVFAKGEIVNKKMASHQFTTDPLEYFSPEKPSSIPQLDAATEEAMTSPELPLLLFIDDNADIRKFIRIGFENDFRIIEAENGVKGLKLAKSSLPDIIISDIMMPEMDGITLCRTLKSNTGTSHIPVVLLTAKMTPESEIEGLETGADAYVKKPFQLNILKQQIINIYGQREKLKSRFRQEIILEPSEITVTTVDEAFLKKAMDLIEDHMSDAEYNVEALVKDMYISRSKLYLKIKALTGQSTSEFIRTIRLKRAVQLLEKSDFTIKEIMFKTGFNTASYFSKCFKKQYGIVPSEYVGHKRKTMDDEKK